MVHLAEELLRKEEEYHNKIRQREKEIEELRNAAKNAEILRSSLEGRSQHPNDANSSREKSVFLFKLVKSLRDVSSKAQNFFELFSAASLHSERLTRFLSFVTS